MIELSENMPNKAAEAAKHVYGVKLVELGGELIRFSTG
jgi:hypothetical protein